MYNAPFESTCDTRNSKSNYQFISIKVLFQTKINNHFSQTPIRAQCDGTDVTKGNLPRELVLSFMHELDYSPEIEEINITNLFISLGRERSFPVFNHIKIMKLSFQVIVAACCCHVYLLSCHIIWYKLDRFFIAREMKCRGDLKKVINPQMKLVSIYCR